MCALQEWTSSTRASQCNAVWENSMSSFIVASLRPCKHALSWHFTCRLFRGGLIGAMYQPDAGEIQKQCICTLDKVGLKLV